MSSNPRTATFLFTDLENSTPIWENHPDVMQELAAHHDALLREAIEAHRGQVVKTTGDGFHAAFEAATDAVEAALAGQLALIAETWPAETGPLRVRMGLHTGESRQRAGDYYGSEVNRAARVMGIAHGGQVLVSEATAALLRHARIPDLSLADLGEHRLRGLALAERIFQVHHPALPSDFPPPKSLSVYKHNLPAPVSTFIGRERELADVRRLLQNTRLLTLLGPGGTGKTRLALESAEALAGEFADGVWLVELGLLTDSDLIAERVAAALSVQEQPARAMMETLVDFLRRKELLLLLDNVEHLVQKGAELVEYLLSHCPSLKILVTGREALFIDGEVTLQIPSLSLPSGGGSASVREIAASEGVQLFLARAQGIRPDFELGPANAPAIADIVRRLDGIPLALELATARLRMLTVQQIAERLNDRFRLLTGGRRTAIPRQQTLQALIDWSWNLLEEKEQVLLRRLSIFSGGWNLDAAQAVASDKQLDEYAVFDALEQLVNKSLVTASYPAEGEVRYGMLESIRQYGQDRLLEAGESTPVRNRHADFYTAFADEAWPHLTRSNMLQWTDRIVQELDNLRAVVAWTLDDRPELALRIGGNLLGREAHWLTPREARSWLEPSIERTRDFLGHEDPRVRKADFIKALLGLALLNGIQGYSAVALPLAAEGVQRARAAGEARLLAYGIAIKSIQLRFNMSPEAMRELEEAIALSRENGFQTELAWTMSILAIALRAQGKLELALPYYQEVQDLFRKIDNPRNAGLFGFQARLADMLGNREEAKRYASAAIETYRDLKDRRGVVMGQSDLAHILRQNAEFDEAEVYYRKSILGWQELGHPSAIAHQLECFAYIAVARAQFEHAARLLGAAQAARRHLNTLSEDPQEIKDLAGAMDQLAAAIGEKERDQAIEEGKRISLDDAVQVALNG